MKGAVKSVLMAALLFLLSGCFLVDMQITVSSDDTVTGTMTLALEEEAASLFEELGDDALIDVSDLPEGATAAPYEQDGYVGQTVTFQDVPLEEFNASMAQDDGAFTLVREGDNFKFTGTIDMSSGESGTSESQIPGLDEALEEALASGSMTLSMTFPGEVTDTNGEVDGTTVTWDLADFMENSEVYATASAEVAEESADSGSTATDASAEAESDSSFPVVPVVIGVVAGILIIGGAAFLITRRRKG